jgi:hypothetical protein
MGWHIERGRRGGGRPPEHDQTISSIEGRIAETKRFEATIF